MNSTSTKFALPNTLNNSLRAHLAVATREDADAISHKVMRIGLHRAPLGRLDATGRDRAHHLLIDGLSNSWNDRITIDGKLGAWNGNWATTTTGIRLTELITLEL